MKNECVRNCDFCHEFIVSWEDEERDMMERLIGEKIDVRPKIDFENPFENVDDTPTMPERKVLCFQKENTQYKFCVLKDWYEENKFCTNEELYLKAEEDSTSDLVLVSVLDIGEKTRDIFFY